MALTITTPGGVQHIPPQASTGPAVPDPTGAPDGQVPTTTGGAYGLAAPAGGIDTSLRAAPDTGWTAAGNGTASIASGVATFVNTPFTTSARLHRPNPVSSPYCPMVEALCRCTLVTANGAINQGIGVTNAAFTRGVIVVIDGSNYQVWYSVSGSWVFVAETASGGTANWLAGTVWLRIVVTDAYAHCYYAVGPTTPTSWTRIASVRLGDASPDFAQALGDGLTDLVVFTRRAGGLSNDEMRASDIQWRSLLGAPT